MWFGGVVGVGGRVGVWVGVMLVCVRFGCSFGGFVFVVVRVLDGVCAGCGVGVMVAVGGGPGVGRVVMVLVVLCGGFRGVFVKCWWCWVWGY